MFKLIRVALVLAVVVGVSATLFSVSGHSRADASVVVPAECTGMNFNNVIDHSTDASGSRISGTPGADLIFGSAFNDRINAGAGNDCIVGGAGNDLIAGDSGADVLIGGAGNDNCIGGSGSDKEYSCED